MKIKNLIVNYKKIISLSLALGFVFMHGLPKANADTSTIKTSAIVTEFQEDEGEREIFDDSLKSFGAFSQKDERWASTSYRGTNISSGGCGPLSITNGLSIAFNISNPSQASSILNDVINIGSNYRNINNVLLGNNIGFLILVVKGNFLANKAFFCLFFKNLST